MPSTDTSRQGPSVLPMSGHAAAAAAARAPPKPRSSRVSASNRSRSVAAISGCARTIASTSTSSPASMRSRQRPTFSAAS
jgi:hypothetical protein